MGDDFGTAEEDEKNAMREEIKALPVNAQILLLTESVVREKYGVPWSYNAEYEPEAAQKLKVYHAIIGFAINDAKERQMLDGTHSAYEVENES